MARLNRLRNRARYPGEVWKSGIYEQIVKSCQNQVPILRKLNFGFPRGKSIYRGVSKNLHYILNFGINPNKNRIIKILFYEFIFTMIGGVSKKFTLFGRKFYFSCLIFFKIHFLMQGIYCQQFL